MSQRTAGGWYTRRLLRRLGLAKPEERPLGAVETISPSARPGARFVSAPYTVLAPRPYWMASPTQPNPTADPGHPEFDLAGRLGVAFVPPGQKSGRAISAADAIGAVQRHEAYLDACVTWRDEIKARADAYPSDPVRGVGTGHLLRGEADLMRKIAFQNGRHFAAFLGRLGTPGKLAPPEAFVTILRRVCQAVARAAGAHWDEVQAKADEPDPIITNGGLPAGFAGPLANLASCAAFPASAPASAWAAECARFHLSVGADPALAGAYILGYRSGPASKAFPNWVPGLPGVPRAVTPPGTWSATTEVQGGWPRSRHIFMAPKAANHRLAQLFGALYIGLKYGTPGFDHSGTVDDDAVAAVVNDLFVMESDISAFDQNVGAPLQDAVEEQLLAAFAAVLDADHPLLEEIKLWRIMERAPVVSPGWNLGSSSVMAVGAWGGTHSGLKLTSVIGTIICLAATLYALEQQKSGAVNAYFEGTSGVRRSELTPLLCLVLGDDILLGTRWPLDAAAWEASWNELGLPTELFYSARFLMKLRTGIGSFNMLARAMQNSAYPEKPPVGKHALGLWAVGAVSRLRMGASWSEPKVLAAFAQLGPFQHLAPYATSTHDLADRTLRKYESKMAAALAAAKPRDLLAMFARAEYDVSVRIILESIAALRGMDYDAFKAAALQRARDLWRAADWLTHQPLPVRSSVFRALIDMSSIPPAAFIGGSASTSELLMAASALRALPEEIRGPAIAGLELSQLVTW